MTTLSAQTAAAELGRSADWFLKNRQRLEFEEGLPQPVTQTPPYAWNAVQFYAWLDRNLPPTLSDKCTLIRAASHAMATTPDTIGDAEEIANWQAKLDEKYG